MFVKCRTSNGNKLDEFYLLCHDKTCHVTGVCVWFLRHDLQTTLVERLRWLGMEIEGWEGGGGLRVAVTQCFH